MKRIIIRVAAAVAAAVCAPAWTQGFPARPVTIVVPYAPGGTADILGRIVSIRMAEALGQQVVIEYRPGAGGNIGAESVAKRSAPEGYTILLTATSLASSPSLMRKMPFDPVKDLAPVAGLATIPNIAVASNNLPVKSIAELVSMARTQPGKLTFASSGPGTSNHLAAELFKVVAGVDMLHVPYKSAGQALPDLISGRVDLMFDLMPSMLPQVKQGKVRGLAVTSAKRSPAIPELQTVQEAGVPGYEFTAWHGFFAPAGTPADVLRRLNGAINKALENSEVRAQIVERGAEPMSGGPEDFGRYFRNEVEKWARVVKDSKLPPLD